MPLIITDIQPLTEPREAHRYCPIYDQVSCNRPTLLFFTHISILVSTRFGVHQHHSQEASIQHTSFTTHQIFTHMNY